MEKEEEILKEKRSYIINLIFEKRKELHRNASFYDKYFLQIKSWCITIFMISTGFCLKEKELLGLIFYILPLLPVILFWFLHAYKQYRIDNYLQHNDAKSLEDISINVYNYSDNEIDNIIKNLVNLNFNWPNKGQCKICRFFRKKLPGILKKFFSNFENLVFFGGMVFFWLLVITIKQSAPDEIQHINKTTVIIWGAEEAFWQEIPIGTKMEIWVYGNKGSLSRLYFLNDNDTLAYKVTEPKGVVYEPSQ